jgi:hypothetical protein
MIAVGHVYKRTRKMATKLIIHRNPIPYKAVYVIKQYPDKTQGDVKWCQICDEERFATVKCLNCEDYLCKQCHEYHTKVKSLKEHTYEIVVSQSHISRVHASEKHDSEKIECNIHRKELLLFCKPCNSVICEDCRTNAHKHHQVKTIHTCVL